MGRDWVIETHAQISIRWLGRHGLFQRKPDDFLFVQIADVQFAFVNKDRYSIKVFCIYNGMPHSETIELDYVRVKFGYNRYFICPMSGKRITILHYIAGIFASRAAFRGSLSVKNGSPAARQDAQRRRRIDRLLGRDGRGPARGPSRARLIESLRYDRKAMRLYPELESKISRYDSQQRATRRARHWGGVKRGPCAMASVLQHGPDLADAPVLDAHRKQPAQYWISVSSPPAVPDLPRPLAILEDCIAVDIRAISKRFDMATSGLWGVDLDWPQPGGVLVNFWLVVDLRDRDHACLAIYRAENGIDSPVQLIRIRQPFSSRRWSMVCPITGKNCDLLYWRSDFFASEKVQRLVRRSQRAQ